MLAVGLPVQGLIRIRYLVGFAYYPITNYYLFLLSLSLPLWRGAREGAKYQLCHYCI